MGALNSQRGVSIVELMLAVAISGFLVLAISSLFVGNSRTMKTQNAMAELSDNGRYALDRLSRDIRMLGFKNSDFTGDKIANSLVATDDQTDSLSVTFEAPRDCNRTPADVTGFVTNAFSIVNGNLECNGQILVRGIEDFQILFGEDLDADRIANRYVDSTVASLDLDRVVSIRLGVVAASAAGGGAAGLGVATQENDKRLRREFTVTIALRNRI